MIDMNDITAIILAGGRGTRLSGVVADRPKVLADVGGRPFLTYLLDQLEKAGIRRAVISTGYRAEMVRQTLGESHGSIELHYRAEPQPLGTGGGIRLAAEAATSDPVLVMNGDSYVDVDLRSLLRFHHDRGGEGSLVLTQVGDVSRFGAVQVGEGDQIERFIEKNAAGGAGWINAGVYVLGRRLIDSIPSGAFVSLEKELFPKWLPMGLFGFRTSGRFIDIGTPKSYAAAAAFFSRSGFRN